MILADLHIHSRYSRATSPQCVPEYLDLWARRKGISLLGTGDFTHPAWRQELQDGLIPAEDGLYMLRENRRIKEDAAYGQERPRFVLSGEISSIYKKNGKTRKVHNVILLPSLEAAQALSQKLEAIGNIHSDGRPILGLDSRDLLEITLEACTDAIFIPAHIWTPHFSLFGAFSGFDTIEECFEDLTPYIYALETGLSSDPPMNWQLSALDRFTLVSNSDAHSPSKLGREANLLDIPFSYAALKKALQEGEQAGFRGTIEFFPEEGKYHLDGHRNCNLCLTPEETKAYGGKCPVCGKKITIGVQHRVEELADRALGYRPANANPFESLAPLPEAIAASTGLSAAGKKVSAQYEAMLQALGPEFYILRQAPLEDIRRVAGPLVEEGIRRLRQGKVERNPGFDGEYGTIELLSQSERDTLGGQISLFGVEAPMKKKKTRATAAPKESEVELAQEIVPEAKREALNAEQKEAVEARERAIAVIAGPGTGKTKTLVERIAHLVESGIKPSEITAVTFTNQAAKEMRARLEQRLGGKRAVRPMTIGTFHSICLDWLQGRGETVRLLDEFEALALAAEAIKACGVKQSPKRFLQDVSKYKNGSDTEPEKAAYASYQRALMQAGAMDFDDLLLKTLELWRGGKVTPAQQKPFSHLLVDEFQDCNRVQYQLLRAWNKKGKSLFVIGDPDQAIYGFRGADAACFTRLADDVPGLREIQLRKNYRSTPEILHCALPVISHNKGPKRTLEAQHTSGRPVRLLTAESGLAEGIFVAKEINRMVGGIDMLDSETIAYGGEERSVRDFADIAVLYRTHRQAAVLEKCLRQEGIPYVVVGRDDFLADPAVRGTLCFFRCCLEPSDGLSWQTFETLLGNGTAEEKDALLEAYTPMLKKKPEAALAHWIGERGLQDSEPMERLVQMAVLHRDMASFLNAILLGQEQDLVRSPNHYYTSGAVTLMTLHGAKGLEYPVVFLCGVNRGIIPLEGKGHEPDWEEERRLFYVGLTRAKEELILLTGQEPSPFLEEIPADKRNTGPASPKKRQPAAKQLSFFD